jgi:hypothetical protein
MLVENVHAYAWPFFIHLLIFGAFFAILRTGYGQYIPRVGGMNQELHFCSIA